MSDPTLLAIESSCDDTAAAVVRGDALLSSVVSSQLLHEQYGGIVPEIASRAHQRVIVPVVDRTLSDARIEASQLDAVAVTEGPGLAGSLLVGISFAKALAFALERPLIGVNHLEGHVFSVFTERNGPDFPFVCLIVSGGHTQLMLIRGPQDYQLLGRTRDDAAGEAFDKIGTLMGLGYPGGPIIDRIAADGDPTFRRFPRSRPGRFDFSFSGLKTSVLYYLNEMDGDERRMMLETHGADIAASVQEAIVDVLIDALNDAVTETGVRDVAITGGVSANRRLRRRAEDLARRIGVHLHVPETRFATDNAAMIATAAQMKFRHGITSPLSLTASPALNF